MKQWKAVLLGCLLTVAAGAAQTHSSEWLSLCSKCLSPTVTSKSGIGTAHATAEARITRDDVESWCDNWSPGDPTCVKAQLAETNLNKIYRANADCLHGTIKTVAGTSYTLAGVWTSGVGKGRTRWKGADGKIVGQDNASGGLAISQQWEVLCPAKPAAVAR